MLICKLLHKICTKVGYEVLTFINLYQVKKNRVACKGTLVYVEVEVRSTVQIQFSQLSHKKTWVISNDVFLYFISIM